MSSLSRSLTSRCHALLAQCKEFASPALLRAVFVTEDLKPFQTGLPEAASAEERARLVLAYLLDHSLADGRAPLVLLLDILQEHHAREDLGVQLLGLKDDVQAYLGTRSGPAATKRQNRRIDAALPAQADLKQHIDLYVQVRFPRSKPLSIADWPVKHRPAQTETQSSTVALNFPVNARTGKPGPIVLQLHVTAPDFKVEDEEPKKRVEVLPGKFSNKVQFLLTPLHTGVCRVNVGVKSTDEVSLGTLPLEMKVGGAAAPEPAAVVANLVLTVEVKAAQSPAGRTVVVVPGLAPGVPFTLNVATPEQLSLKLRETTGQLQGLCAKLEKAATPSARLSPKALRQMSWLRAQYLGIVNGWQGMKWTNVPPAQRRDMLEQAATAAKQLDMLSRLLPSARTVPIAPGMPGSAADLTHSFRGLSANLNTLKIKS